MLSDLSPVITTGLDMQVFAVALSLSLSLGFGVTQLLFKNLVPEYKPTAFVVVTAAATVGLYYALMSDLQVVKLVIAAVSAAYGVTGGIDFYKKDVKG